MQQTQCELPCGCIRGNEKLYHECGLRRRLVARRDLLVKQPNLGGKERLIVEDEIRKHDAGIQTDD